MGAWYAHKCDNCQFEVHTDGPWEFYRDKKGRRKIYGHPEPASQEAAECGIAGLTGRLYCPKCGNTQLVFDDEWEPIPCPRCKKRKLVGRMTMIS